MDLSKLLLLYKKTQHSLFSYHGEFADFKKKIPVTESTTFNGYSITKTFLPACRVKAQIYLRKPGTGCSLIWQ